MLDCFPTPILAPLPQLEGPPQPSRPRIAIKSDGRILFTDTAEVVAVEAQGNYVLLRRISGSAPTASCAFIAPPLSTLPSSKKSSPGPQATTSSASKEEGSSMFPAPSKRISTPSLHSGLAPMAFLPTKY